MYIYYIYYIFYIHNIQLLETLLLSIKMCTDFPTDVIMMKTICAMSRANHLRAVADVFRPLRTHQHY